MEYQNFDIRILSNHPYSVLAEHMKVGEAEGILDLTPDAPEVRDALLRLASRQTDQAHLTEFGNLLFQRLFAEEVGARFEQATGYSQAEDEQGLRIRLRINSPELAALPWELLFTPSRSFLGTNQNSPITRWLYVPRPIRNLLTPLPLRVLVAIPEIGKPFPPLEVGKEIAAIKKALSVMKKEVELTILKEEVSLDRIGHTLIEQAYQVIHFIGHAEFCDNQGRILLNGRQGGMEWINEDRFGVMLKNQGDLKLVVLNACQGATVSNTQAFVGIAPNLVRAGVPAVVAMQYPIYDDAAILFAQEFYYALFRGPNAGRIDWAMAHARSTLMRDFPDEREIATPVLFLRAPEGVLFYKVTGKRLLDAAFSRASMDTEKAIEKTHHFNQSLAHNSEALQDENLPAFLDKDKRDYAYLKKRIAFSRRVVMASTATFVLVFIFFWVGLLDLLRLDTLLEGFTLAVGNTMTEKNRSEEVVIVAIDKPIDASWRDDHAVLVDQLAKAKAKVVVFDMTFEPNNDPDIAPKTQAFANAIAEAHLRGTKVVLGFRSLKGEDPVIEQTLQEVLDYQGLGAICLSGKLDYYSVAPILIEKPPRNSNEKTSHPSLALAAFFASIGVEDHRVDFQEKRINLDPLDMGILPFSEKRLAHGSKCAANQRGDVNADLFIDLTPAELIRDDLHALSYDKVMSGEFEAIQPGFFTDKVVFVGERSQRETFNVFDLDNGKRFGVELHADTFKTIQRSHSGSAIVRPLATGYQSLMIIAMAFLGGYIRFLVKPAAIRWRVFLLIGLPLVYVGAVFWLCVSQHLLIDWLYHLAGFFFAYFLTGRVEKRWF